MFTVKMLRDAIADFRDDDEVLVRLPNSDHQYCHIIDAVPNTEQDWDYYNGAGEVIGHPCELHLGDVVMG